MAGIFRQRYTKTDPKTGDRVTRESKRWYIKYRDANGIERRVPGHRDKEATRQMAARLEREAARRQEGLTDPFAQHAKTSLTEHLNDFERHLEAKENTPRYIKLKVGRVRDALTNVPLVLASDIASGPIERWLAQKRQDGLSARTVNFYLSAIKSFTKWMLRDERIARDSLAHMTSKLPVATDVRRKRRSLSSKEFGRLIQATRTGEPFRSLDGQDRAMLYIAAANTGFRCRELASLTPAAFELESDPPTVVVAASYSKHRRDDVQPLLPAFVELLRPWLASRPADQACWPGTWHARAADMIKGDLAAAGIKYEDAKGRVFDFHALRHHFISQLAGNRIHPSRAQRLARHSSVELTLDTYTHVELDEMATALGEVDPATLGLTPRLTPAADSPCPSQSSADAKRSDEACDEKLRSSKEPNALDTDGHPVAAGGAGELQAIPAGLEPATCGLGNRCSILLSYGTSDDAQRSRDDRGDKRS